MMRTKLAAMTVLALALTLPTVSADHGDVGECTGIQDGSPDGGSCAHLTGDLLVAVGGAVNRNVDAVRCIVIELLGGTC